MGKNNRRRRAAKQRRRAAAQRNRRARAASADAAPTGKPTDNHRARPSDPETLFNAAVYALHVATPQEAELLLDELTALPREEVAGAVERELTDQLGALWTRGWEPAMVDRVVEQRLDDHERTLVRSLIATGARSYEDLGRRVAPAWMRQVDDIDTDPLDHPERAVLPQLTIPWAELLRAAIRLMALMLALPDEPTLRPPPDEWRDGMHTRSSNLPDGLLEKVRGLLAKAESTGFDAEAEAFTAKAQELMTRHRLDRAVLEGAARDETERPSGRRMFIDSPYAEAKTLLLAAIAAANGGHTVWSKEYGWSTVFAFADELDIIEDLFTSLLVQATAALRREGSKVDAGGRSRTTRFRRSFLVAFARRIGYRLQEEVDATVADVEETTGCSLVPVLTDRADAARDAAENAYTDLRTFSPSATDREGWYAGTLFGDQADVGVGAPVTREAAS